MERRWERPGSERHPMVSVICSDARPRPMVYPAAVATVVDLFLKGWDSHG